MLCHSVTARKRRMISFLSSEAPAALAVPATQSVRVWSDYHNSLTVTDIPRSPISPDIPHRYPLPISLSATTVVRLKQVGREEYETWSKRSLEGQRFVYLWADGLYSNLRLDDDRPCLLVVIAALADGRKQLLAVHDGFHESELSWTELLEDLKRRGLEVPPKLAVGDGGLGFWAALQKVYPTTREQQRFNARATTPQHSNT